MLEKEKKMDVCLYACVGRHLFQNSSPTTDNSIPSSLSSLTFPFISLLPDHLFLCSSDSSTPT